MKKAVAFTAVLLLLMFGGWLAKAQTSGTSYSSAHILEFETMFGVTGPFLGAANAIQGVPGAGAAWTNPQNVDGKLKSDGEVDIQVSGLVLVATGTNPLASFRGIVSCRSIDTSTTPPSATTVVVATGAFPASPSGDSDIQDTVALPSPCVAPIVFVGPGTGALQWLAVTGIGAGTASGTRTH